MTISERVAGFRKLALTWATRGRPIALLLVRLSLAAVFVQSGWGKVHDLAKVTGYFTELGIPAPHANAVFVSFIELGCGALLLMGLGSRLAALPLIPNMAVAIISARRDDIHGLADLFALDESLYIVLSLVVVAFGPGLVSLDTLVARMFGGSTDAVRTSAVATEP